MNPDQKKQIETLMKELQHVVYEQGYMTNRIVSQATTAIQALITQAVQAERQRLLEAIGEDEPTTEDWLETGNLLNTRTYARNELRAVLREALNQEDNQ